MYYPGNCLEWPRKKNEKATTRIATILAEVLTGHMPDTTEKHFNLNQSCSVQRWTGSVAEKIISMSQGQAPFHTMTYVISVLKHGPFQIFCPMNITDRDRNYCCFTSSDLVCALARNKDVSRKPLDYKGG